MLIELPNHFDYLVLALKNRRGKLFDRPSPAGGVGSRGSQP